MTRTCTSSARRAPRSSSATPRTTGSCSRNGSGSEALALAELTVVSANLHWGYGYGRTYRRPYDVAAALLGFDADAYVLPETFRADSGPGMLDGLVAAGYQVEMMPMRRWRLFHSTTAGRGWRPPPGVWCLSIATRLPVLERRELPIGKAFHDPVGPRTALRVDLAVGEQRVHLVGVHTSSKLWYGAPIVHMRRLRRQLPVGPEPAIVAGDFNFWGPGVVATLRNGWRRTVRGRTWPAHRPHSQIDHILVNDAVKCLEAEVLPPFGSDHRAVRARLAV